MGGLIAVFRFLGHTEETRPNSSQRCVVKGPEAIDKMKPRKFYVLDVRGDYQG